jgi:monoamine oxidase
LGGYSFPTLQSTEARKLIGTPVENTIFFAGEALYDGKNGGTVEAAISSAMTASGLIQH